MDKFDPVKRSELMSRIRAKNTKPELKVRKMLFALGFRFRLNDRKLPGVPDIVLKKYRAVVFVHGCFWHGHEGCKKSTIPATHREFWSEKLERNKQRDKEVKAELLQEGMRVLVIWECACKKRYESELAAEMSSFLLDFTRRYAEIDEKLLIENGRNRNHDA